MENLKDQSLIIKEKHLKDHKYGDLLEAVKVQANSFTSDGVNLFVARVDNLFDIYLNNLEEDIRQEYNCNCCRQFITRFGSLVTIDDETKMTKSIIWNEELAPEIFKESFKAMRLIVEKSKIDCVFRAENTTAGTPVSKGDYHHFAIELPEAYVIKDEDTRNEKVAELSEDFKLMITTVLKYDVKSMNDTINMLETDKLFRKDKYLPMVQWLKDIIVARTENKHSICKENIIWAAIASCPSGFSHVKNSSIGTVMDAILSGDKDFDNIVGSFNYKVDPIRFQRAQTEASEANIKEAGEYFAKNNLEKSLERKFATEEEIPESEKLWVPTVIETPKVDNSGKTGGVFSSLLKQNEEPEVSDIGEHSPTIMTWRKFEETVLPKALNIEYKTTSYKDNFVALVTANDLDAPPIISYDKPEQRNPFSTYMYSDGSYASNWNLTFNKYVKVNFITRIPNLWFGNKFDVNGVILVLDGAKDNNKKENPGSSVFPELLKSDLRKYRKTIEQYSNNNYLLGFEEASACGLFIGGNSGTLSKLRVTTETGVRYYKIDRMD